MTKLAVIADGIVINTILGDPGFGGGVECPEEVGVGWSYDGQAFSPPDPEPVSIDDARDSARSRIETAYCNALKSFSWNGTTWDASDDRATILRDILNRLANGRGLPRGKSTVTLRDNSGASHDLTAEQVIDLGEAGSDHRDECLEIRLDLLDQVRASDTVEAVEEIDWPALD